MKVMLVGSDAAVSGAGLSMIALDRELKKLDVETVMVVRKGNTQRILEQQGRKYYSIKAQGWECPIKRSYVKRFCFGWAKIFLNIIPNIQMYRIIKRENPDIVHLNTLTHYLGAAAAIHYRKKLVWHVRELMEEDLGVRFFHPRYARRTIEKTDCLISISKSVFNKYRVLFPKVTHEMIYNGVDLEKYADISHIPFLKPTIVFTIAGYIGEHKGQYEVLVGLKNLLKSDIPMELRIAGKGSEAELIRLKSYMSENEIPLQKVKFLGFVEDMPALWSQTDIAVVASRCEAFGRVTVEAMAAGCLVLGANTGGTDELIENGVTGVKYHQGDPDSLAERAEYILAHREEMKRIAASGRSYAVQNFTAERNARQVKEVYLNLLKDKEKMRKE